MIELQFTTDYGHAIDSYWNNRMNTKTNEKRKFPDDNKKYCIDRHRHSVRKKNGEENTVMN